MPKETPMLPDTAASKVTAAHLSRTALLYVRQSSLKQVIHNTESAIRQYDLRGRAIALGWAASQITVIDIDQGHSGASAADRCCPALKIPMKAALVMPMWGCGKAARPGWLRGLSGDGAGGCGCGAGIRCR